MTLPNFIVIGAPRCGTTSLYHYLMPHPQVFMSPVKEPRFFIYAGTSYTLPDVHSVSRLSDYERLFNNVQDEIAIGEATPTYIGRSGVPARIKQYIPDCKLIALLRHPTERTISHYQFLRLYGKELRTLSEVIAGDRATLLAPEVPFNTYISFGLYHHHLQRFLGYFSREQLLIELFEDFVTNTPSVLSRIYEFLGVNSAFLPDTLHTYNAYQVPRSAAVIKLLSHDNIAKRVYQQIAPPRFREWVNRTLFHLNTKESRPMIAPEIRQQLIDTFRDDTLKLQDFLQRDLSHWLE